MWTTSLPNECGYYWFYGRIKTQHTVGPLKLSIIQVSPESKQIFDYPLSGQHPIHSIESFVGWFQKVNIPDLPEKEIL